MGTEKIIFVNRFFFPDYSATSQILSDLAFDFAKSGRCVEVICSRLLYDGSAVKLNQSEVIDRVQVNRVWTSSFGKKQIFGRLIDYLTFYVSAAWMLWKVTTPNSVVVVKTDPPLFSIVASVIVRFRGAKLVNWLQDIFPEVASALGVKMMRWPLLPLLKSLRNMSLNAADINVVIGRLMKEKLLRDGVSPTKIRIIPNWADGSKIKPVPRTLNVLREKWGLGEKFVVGYSGNLGHAHEFSTIIDAIENLQYREDIVFLFIGGGVQRSLLEHEVRFRKLENVLFKSYQARDILSESLGVSDIHLVSLNPVLESLIVPSKFYGIAAVARPTIFIGDCLGEIASVIDEFECGYSVGSGDDNSLLNKILVLADSPDLAISQGLRARAAFDLNYDKAIAYASFKHEVDQLFENSDKY